MRLVSKWEKMKVIAAANKVPYSTYIKRLHKGWSYEEAASTTPLIRHATEDTVKRPAPKPKEAGPENPMGRQAALKKIDEVVNANCNPCRLRNRLDTYCLQECQIGKELQELGKHLKRERKSRAGRG
ncbi:zinc-finger domain-containing protein [Paenibacillus sp. FSL K6-1318]|uniref:zinc-finger domain-containing protein n=1 Tax=Paenibacillus sp. FSL K6-1318 TaxID=2975291 RepID=UPI0030EF7A88